MAVMLLERFGLAEVALQRAGTLSGGQQQRVAICRALLQEPAMLLADEPIASLDPHNARVVMDALRTVNRQDGLTVLVCLHHLDAARAWCNRIIAMQSGRIVFDGTPAQLTSEQGVRHLWRDRGRIPRRPRAAGSRVMVSAATATADRHWPACAA